MSQQSANPGSPIDVALERLREERSACVRRLQQMLALDGHGSEVSGYLSRIESINQALMRLARTQCVQ